MEDVLLQAVAAARQAGEAIVRLRGAVPAARLKSDGSPVTDADLVADRIIRHGLAGFGWPILSEESADGSDRLLSEYVWIVDPLDGTKAFLDGGDDFVVMIALVERGKPVLAVLYQPAADKLYRALRGRGAFLERGGAVIKLLVSHVADQRESRMIMSRHHPAPEAEALARSLGVTEVVRVGSNGVKFGLIAEGRFDLLVNPTDQMREWDLCAPQLILEEAGGRVTGMRGEEIVYNKAAPVNPYGILATNGALHAQVLEQIQSLRGRSDILQLEGAGQGMVLWFTGLSGSGKTTIAEALKEKLEANGKRVRIVDGDAVRDGSGGRLGFSREDIRENNRRIAELARAERGTHDAVLVTVISPYAEDRAENRAIVGPGYVEVFVDCPLAVCAERDPKGLYRRARSGEIVNLIGFSPGAPYEEPMHPDVTLDTSRTTVAEGVEMLLERICEL